jgi:protein-tyrosine kinase
MEALERARAERESLGGSETRPPAPESDNPKAIRYTRTRTEPVGRPQLRESRVVSAFEDSPFTEAFRILSTQVLQRLREHGAHTLAVTSPVDGEGKTLTAVNLALSLASWVDATVLLVDADLRRPAVHSCFGLPAAPGLSDYLLRDEADIADLLVRLEGIDRFVFLPGGGPLANSAEMLGSPRMAHLVAELKARYASRIVVFDLPPVLTTADALAFAPCVETVLLVLEDGRSRAEDARRAAELLQKTRLIGTVLNKSRDLPEQRDVGARGTAGRSACPSPRSDAPRGAVARLGRRL